MQSSQLPELESALASLQCRYESARTQADGGTALLSAERELARLEAEACQVILQSYAYLRLRGSATRLPAGLLPCIVSICKAIACQVML